MQDGDRATKFIEIPIIDNSIPSGSNGYNHVFLINRQALDSDQAYLGRQAAHVSIIDDEQADRPVDWLMGHSCGPSGGLTAKRTREKHRPTRFAT